MTTLHCPSRPKNVDDLIRRMMSKERDLKETVALQALAQNMVEIFQNDKRTTYLSEAAQLAAVVDETQYRTLISTFCNAIIEYTFDNNVLDPAILRTFALALRRKGALSADSSNLGAALGSLNQRLDLATKAAEKEKQYHLICTLGTVLDAMVDIQITGLDREWLHKPLLDQLRTLRNDPEPRLAQAASYAYEALRGVPDNEGPWTAFRRNSWKVISVLATVAGGVSKMDPGSFVDAAPDVMELLSLFKTLVENGKQLYDESQNLKEVFIDSINGLKRPMQWYGALRYCRLLIEAGAFELLRQILSELPACKEPFWWGFYSQLEQSWVASKELKSEIEGFVGWMHEQPCFRTALKDYPSVREWRNLLAGTLKKPEWEMTIPGSYRRHSYQIWRKKQPFKPRLIHFCYQSNDQHKFSCDLLATGWEKCQKAHKYYADARLIQYYTQGDHQQIRRISGDCLDLENCYINLSMIEGSTELGKHREGFELSLRARLKVETPGEGKDIKLPDLFKSRRRPDGSEGCPRRILIRGRAGVGKTTLCKKIIHEFLHGKLWSRNFDRILWIPLRKLKAKPTLESFLRDEFFATSDEKKLLADGLWKQVFGDSNRTLFLLDGFDEVVGERNASGSLVEAFQDLFNQENAIITSRPYAKSSFVAGCDLEMETVGFSSAQVQDYVSRAVKNDTHRKEIRDFIEGHSTIAGLLQIPVQLDALCFTWGEGILAPDAMTMTALYQAIEIKLWRKDMVQLLKTDETRARKYRMRSQVETVMGDEIRLVEMLAFNGLYNNVVEFLPRHGDALYRYFPNWNDSMLDGLSFLRSPESSAIHYFIHLTFQEYFAATYFVHCWINETPLDIITFDQKNSRQNLETKRFVQHKKYNGRYNVMWRFVSGLLSAESNNIKLLEFFQALESEPRDVLGPAHLRLLMHCFNEVDLKKGDSELANIQTEMKGCLSRLLCMPRIVRDKSDLPLLMREMEFPESILADSLKHGSEALKVYILKTLEMRARVSRGLLQKIMDMTDAQNPVHLQKAIYDTLASHSEATSKYIIGILNGPDPVKQQGIAESLRGSSNLPREIVVALIDLLGNSNLEMIETIGSLLRRSVIPAEALHSLLVDKRQPVRVIVSRCLSNQLPLPHESWDAIVDLLGDSDPKVRCHVAPALGRQTDLPQRIVMALNSVVEKDEEVWVRVGAIKSLMKQERLSSEVLSSLEGCVVDNNCYVVKSAVAAFCQHAPLTEYMRANLESRAEGSDRELIEVATEALCEYSTFAEDLLYCLKSIPAQEPISVPVQAVFCFDQFTNLPENILQGLLVHIGDEDWRTRKRAAGCIGRQEALPESIYQALILRLGDEDPEIRASAALVLKFDSKFPNECLSAMLPLLRDPTHYVKSEVTSALASRSNLPNCFLSILIPFLDSDESQDFDLINASYKCLLKSPALSLDILEELLLYLRDWYDSRATEILVTQESLPISILESLITLLENEDGSGRGYNAWQVLRKREEFFFMLPDLTDECMVVLIRGWLKRALREELCCYFRGDTLVIDLPERLWEVPMKRPADRHKFLSALKIAQRDYFGFLPTGSQLSSAQ